MSFVSAEVVQILRQFEDGMISVSELVFFLYPMGINVSNIATYISLSKVESEDCFPTFVDIDRGTFEVHNCQLGTPIIPA
jgi:hypothetical protein